MAIPFFPTFLFISHTLLFHLSQATNKSHHDCPDQFSCGSLNNMSFPLTRSSSRDCGLLMVHCDAKPYPKLEFRGNEYDVEVLDTPFLKLSDRKLSVLLQNKSCQSFNRNISFPNSASISYRVSPIITLIKCKKKATDYHFSYHKRQDCEGFSVYYKNPINGSSQDNTTAKNLPQNCSIIQLPYQQNLLNASGLFSVLTSEFFISWLLSETCTDCHYKLGGQCVTDTITNQFNCLISNGTGTSSSPRKWIVVAACVGGISIFAILMLYFRRKYLRGHIWNLIKTKTKDEQMLENFLATYGSLAPKRYNYSDIRKMTESFRNQLGQGGYGFVYKGKMDDGSPVAIKVLKDLKGDGEGFINEVASISRTSHVNIVTLKGFCFDGGKRALIYEFMSNGSLEKFIYESKSSTSRQLEWKVLYDIAIGIARGLEYLHRGCNTRILHFDIKPHNILLDEDFCPKISDFGLAKMCTNKESTLSVFGARGTIGYIAPEVVCRSIGRISYKSDVYSYGMMVLEMVGGRKNFDGEVSRASEMYFPYWIHSRLELQDLELPGITEEEDDEYARKMIVVSLWCIQLDPAIRPSMSRVVEMLEGNLYNLEIPPNLTLPLPQDQRYILQHDFFGWM